MNTSRFSIFFVLALLTVSLSSCEVIGDIFKAGLWVGIIGVFVVVALIFWLVGKMRR